LAERAVVDSIAAKVFETIERTEHLVSLVPAERLAWQPEFPPQVPPASDVGHLLGHLLDCLAGFCAVFHKAFPDELADFAELRSPAVKHFCSPEQASQSMQRYVAAIKKGFQRCTDDELGRRIVTVFVADGEPLATLLLGNLEHLLNHKYQLFLYLKLAGVVVGSRDLYRFRGAQAADGN
jgi:uncharacterized damage-inducible protein DinB